MKKIFTILLSLCLLMTVASAQELTGEITVLLTNNWGPDTAAGAVLEEAFTAYEEAHPGVTITVNTAASTDIKESFQTAALAGSGADVVITDNSGHAIDMAAMGLLLPLDRFITEEDLLALYQPGPLNSGKFEGAYYSIPWYMNCCGMYVNTDRLKEVGASVPTNWQELEDTLDKLDAAGYGGLITYKSAYAFYCFFYQNGCQVIDTSGEIPQVIADNEAGKEAWDYICRLIDRGYIVESFKEANSWDKAYESFVNGEASILLGGDWCKNSIDKLGPTFEYSVNMMPANKQQATILGGWTWNINANSKNPELAWDMIRYITSSECDYVLDADGRHACRIDFNIDAALAEKPWMKDIASQYGYTMARPAIINEKAIDQIMVDNLLTVIYGQATPEDALATYAQALRDNINENYGE